MPFVRYSGSDKAHAIALAGVVGSEQASAKLGIPAKTIRTWMEQAGKPELAIPRDQLEAASDLALAALTKDLADGRIKGTRLATVVGILQDKVRMAKRDKPVVTDSAIEARDVYADWLVDRLDLDAEAKYLDEHPVPGWDAESTTEQLEDVFLDALDHAMSTLRSGLLVAANAEPRPRRTEEPGPHRSALLAWHSGRTESPAGDVLDWAKALTERWLTEHGCLLAWQAAHEAQRAAERAEWECMAGEAKANALRLFEEAAARNAPAPRPEPPAPSERPSPEPEPTRRKTWVAVLDDSGWGPPGTYVRPAEDR